MTAGMRLLPLLITPLLVAATHPANRLAAAMEAFASHRDREAAAGFRALTDENSAIAETMLGVMYASGRAGGRDAETAVAYWWRAAARGYAPAQLALARAMEDGAGVARDPRAAFFWATIAGRRGEGPTRSAAQTLARELALRLDARARADLVNAADKWRPWPAG